MKIIGRILFVLWISPPCAVGKFELLPELSHKYTDWNHEIKFLSCDPVRLIPGATEDRRILAGVSINGCGVFVERLTRQLFHGVSRDISHRSRGLSCEPKDKIIAPAKGSAQKIVGLACPMLGLLMEDRSSVSETAPS